MKKNLLALIIILLVFSFIEGCKKEDDEQIPPEPTNEEVVLQSDAKYLDDNIWSSSLNSMDSATGTYYFNSSISAQGFTIGDVLASSYGDGALRRVTNIQINGDQHVFSTIQATLEDLFEQAEIDFQQNLTVSDIKSVEYHVGGMKLISDKKSTNYDWEINSVLYDLDNNHQTEFDQIRVEGEFSFDWNFLFKLKISPVGGLKEVKVGVESNEQLNLNLIAGLAYTDDYIKKIATVHFSPIFIPAGPLVIVIIPSLPIYAGVEGYANASITTSIEQGLDFEIGVQYTKADGWSDYASFTKSFDYSPPQLNINAGAEAFIKPEFITKIYGVAGPYVNIKLYGKIEADLLNSPWWTLSAGASLNAGVKAEVFSKVLFDYAIEDIISYEQILAQASAMDPPTAAFSSNQTSGTAPLSVTFTDESVNSPTSWFWDFGDGNTSTLQNPVHTYINVGNYTVSLTSTNESGTDTEVKYGYISVSNGGSAGNFGITSDVHEYNSNWDNIVSNEFGSAYRVADWTDLVSYYNSGGDLLELFDQLGLTEYGVSASVYRNGEQFYSGTRSYFASRHEHNKPSTYLAHENINNYLISLGSWNGSYKIIVIKK